MLLEHCFPYVKAAARERLDMTTTSTPSERVVVVAAGAMLQGLEPTKEGVEPTTLGITAKGIQLDQVYSSVAVTISTLYMA